jgi:hypothetical protein
LSFGGGIEGLRFDDTFFAMSASHNCTKQSISQWSSLQRKKTGWIGAAAVVGAGAKRARRALKRARLSSLILSSEREEEEEKSTPAAIRPLRHTRVVERKLTAVAARRKR